MRKAAEQMYFGFAAETNGEWRLPSLGNKLELRARSAKLFSAQQKIFYAILADYNSNFISQTKKASFIIYK